MTRPITIWERWLKQKDGSFQWEHNHIEEGHCPNDVPTPKVEVHKRTWSGGKWRKFFRHLNEKDVVVILVVKV